MSQHVMLYRRPSEPQAIEVVFDAAIYIVRVRRHRLARRYTLRILAPTREGLPPISPPGAPEGSPRVRAEARRLDCRSSRPFAEGGALCRRHCCAVARRAAPDRAPSRYAR